MTSSELIPAAIGLLGALVGAIGALAGSWLQNRHDASERERERVMAFRREVFLNAAEGLAGQTRYLAGILNLDLALTANSFNLDSNPGWEMKVHSVASLRTIETFSQVNLEFQRIAYQAAPFRYQLEDLQRQLHEERDRQSLIGGWHATLQQMLGSEISQIGFIGRDEEPNRLRAQAEAFGNEIANSCHQMDALLDRIQQARLNLVREVAARVGNHRLLVARAVIQIRKEIEATKIDDDYLTLIGRSNAEAIESTRAFTNSISENA